MYYQPKMKTKKLTLLHPNNSAVVKSPVPCITDPISSDDMSTGQIAQEHGRSPHVLIKLLKKDFQIRCVNIS